MDQSTYNEDLFSDWTHLQPHWWRRESGVRGTRRRSEGGGGGASEGWVMESDGVMTEVVDEEKKDWRRESRNDRGGTGEMEVEETEEKGWVVVEEEKKEKEKE